MKKIRPLGQVTEDMEPLLFEMMVDHEMQIHEVLGIIKQWAETHCDEAIEEYENGKIPRYR